ncbi:PRA1 family protein 2-like isoform X1 [Tachypleus tridentatus]|uniref:PRA1 family protein 2-like isoform X1 n=1 Tax=Tachypleus tridentatus TaxID=6853 RepID=UPI003FD3D876
MTALFAVTEKMAEVEISPMRTLDDFILGGAKFQIPNFKNPDKWANRVMNNLLYYQTNYFLMAVLVFLIIGIIHPAKMLCGMMAICVAFGLFYYVTNTKRSATRFKQEHPVISLAVIFIGGYFIVYMFGAVVIFLFGIGLPLLLMIIHASMRSRNLKNKLTNKIETVGLRKTPMGVFLEALGQEPDFTLKAEAEVTSRLSQALKRIAAVPDSPSISWAGRFGKS